ncbi:hypothetical protein [Bacillus sp. AK031]
MEIKSYHGAGQLNFTMTKEEIRQALGESPEIFMKGGDSPAEQYVKSGLLIYYKEDNETVEAIEFTSSSSPVFQGVKYLNMKGRKAINSLKSLDPDLFEQSDGVISIKLGISLWIPYRKVESLLIFAEKGYYDEYFQLLEEIE